MNAATMPLDCDSQPSGKPAPMASRAKPRNKNPHNDIRPCLMTKIPISRSRVSHHCTSDQTRKTSDSIQTEPVTHSTHRVRASATGSGCRARWTCRALVLCSLSSTTRSVVSAGTSKVNNTLPRMSSEAG